MSKTVKKSEKGPVLRGPSQKQGDDPISKNQQNKWKRKNLSLILIMVIVTLVALKLVDTKNPVKEITYSEFKQLLVNQDPGFQRIELLRNNEGYLATATRELTDREREDSRKNNIMAPTREGFRVQMPFSDDVHKMVDSLNAGGIQVKYAKDSQWMGWIGSLLPLILIIAFVWFMMSRQTQAGGPRGIFSFGKSNAKLNNSENPETTFNDVAGCDEAKQDLQEVIDFLKHPDLYSTLGGKIPKGALLLGPPGTGKTLLAKAVAGEASVPFFSMSGSDFVEMFVGVGASRVRDLFEQGKKNAPCIIFIDEIDAVGRHRGAGLGGGHDEREQTLNQLLVEMDGFTHNAGVILLAATNRPDVLDPALLRPGRFDRQIVVDAPDAKGREGILRVHLEKRKVPLDSDVELEKIAKGTPGLVGADIENLVNEACLMAARFKNKKVGMQDFEEAKDKIMLGTERVSRIISDEEKKTTAYHEAGHALITTLMKHADPLHKITIIPRGRALGITFSLPAQDVYSFSSDKIKDNIAILMGGRSAEQLFLNQRTTGASNDIERATELARKYVCEWGMSEEMGPMAYGKKQEEIFLGREISQYRTFSEATAQKIDKEVKDLVITQMKIVDKLLIDHKDELKRLAEALLEHEVLEGDEIYAALEGKDITTTRKSRSHLSFEQAKLKKRKEAKINSESKDLESQATLVSDTENTPSASEEDDVPRGLNVDTKA